MYVSKTTKINNKIQIQYSVNYFIMLANETLT